MMKNRVQQLKVANINYREGNFIEAMEDYWALINEIDYEFKGLEFNFCISAYKAFKSAEFSAEVIDRTVKNQELSELVKGMFVYLKNAHGTSFGLREINKIVKSISILARSSLLHLPFLSKRTGKIYNNRTHASLNYFLSADSEISPSPLFSKKFYRQVNGLEENVDPVTHFIEVGSLNFLDFHQGINTDECVVGLGNVTNGLSVIEQLQLSNDTPALKRRATFFKSKNVCVQKILCGEESEIKAFDIEIYKQFSPDISHWTDEELVAHWRSYGENENRIATIDRILKDASADRVFIPADFEPSEYASLHKDLEPMGRAGADWLLIWHYLKSGIAEGRPYSWDTLWGHFYDRKVTGLVSIKELNALKENKSKVCILVHLYYPSMWEELLPYIHNSEEGSDLYVNMVDSTFDVHTFNLIRRDCPKSRIYISENRGRDIGGFFELMKNLDFSDYSAFVLMHSKKSPHVTEEYSKRWKFNLLNAIIGSPDVFRNNISLMTADQSIGIIASGRHRHKEMGKNDKLFNKALELFMIDEKYSEIEYVSGSMLIVRSKIMKELFDKGKQIEFEDGDGKSLDFHIDGQWAHVIERLFGNVTKQMGYRFEWV